MPRPRIGKRVLHGLLVALMSAAMLEAVLQFGAWALWMSRPAVADVAPAGGRTILCVGDSWTHGMGSSDMQVHAYPAVLQSIVREHVDASWRVVNGGLAGQDSRDVLERLPGQLRRYTPEHVLILVGQNDEWNLPARLAIGEIEVDAEGGAYRLRWRVPRFFAWLWGKATGAGQVPGGDAGISPEFGLPVGPDWEPRRREIAWSFVPPENPPDLDPRAADLQSSAQEQFRQQDLPTAAHSFEELLSMYPEEPQARQMLVTIYRRTGELERAHELLAEMRQRWREQPSFARGRELVSSLSELGKYAECRALARQLLQSHPEDDHLWSLLAVAQHQEGDAEQALESIDQALARAPREYHFGNRERILRAGLGDLDGAMRTVVDAYLVHNDARWVLGRLRNLRHVDAGSIPLRERFQKVLRGTDCDVGQRQRLEQLAELSFSAADLFTANLAHHLEQMLELCRQHDARPMLLTYPMSNELALPAVQRVAEENGVRLLDVRESFRDHARRRGQAGQWDVLRAADGHCNDAGYALMARFVAADLFDEIAGDLFPELPVGTWRAASEALVLRSDGSGRFGAQTLAWQSKPDTLVLEFKAGPPIKGSWRLEDGRLVIRLGDLALELDRVGGAAAPPESRRGG